MIKHNGPVIDQLAKPSWSAISEFDSQYALRLDTWASAEAQVAALADDIAYNNHDVDDGVLAGLFNLDELAAVPLIGPHVLSARQDYPECEPGILRLEAVRRMIGAMVDDVLAETRRRASGGQGDVARAGAGAGPCAGGLFAATCWRTWARCGCS